AAVLPQKAEERSGAGARRRGGKVRPQRFVFAQDLVDAPLVEELRVEEVEPRLRQEPQAGLADALSPLRLARRHAVVDHVRKGERAPDPPVSLSRGKVRVAPDDLALPVDALGREYVGDGA